MTVDQLWESPISGSECGRPGATEPESELSRRAFWVPSSAKRSDLRRWAKVMGVFWLIQILFFTTFLTNTRNGLATGIVGSLGYWIAQQEVARGGQPWYYYIMLGWLYEFLPMILTAVGIRHGCCTGLQSLRIGILCPPALPTLEVCA